jgi:hypothetical protein
MLAEINSCNKCRIIHEFGQSGVYIFVSTIQLKKEKGHEKIYGSFNPGGTGGNRFLMFNLQLPNIFKGRKRKAFQRIEDLTSSKKIKAAIQSGFFRTDLY